MSNRLHYPPSPCPPHPCYDFAPHSSTVPPFLSSSASSSAPPLISSSSIAQPISAPSISVPPTASLPPNHVAFSQIVASAAASASAHGFSLHAIHLSSTQTSQHATVTLDGVPTSIRCPSNPQPLLMQSYRTLQPSPYHMRPYYATHPAYFTPPNQNMFWSTVMPSQPGAKPSTTSSNAIISCTPTTATPPVKEFMCPRCHSSFKTNSNMQKHIRTVHDNCRPFKCDRCHASYGHKNLLVEHVRTAHDRERPFVCNICSARFGRSSNLYSHMKSHDGKREHQCKQCHVSFSLHGNMVKHYKTVHLKQRPFTCTICNSRFGLRSDLTRHTRNVHGIQDGDSNSNKRIRRSPPRAIADAVLNSQPQPTKCNAAASKPTKASAIASSSAKPSASADASALTDEIMVAAETVHPQLPSSSNSS